MLEMLALSIILLIVIADAIRLYREAHRERRRHHHHPWSR